jgi:hypothetical protein
LGDVLRIADRGNPFICFVASIAASGISCRAALLDCAHSASASLTGSAQRRPQALPALDRRRGGLDDGGLKLFRQGLGSVAVDSSPWTPAP